jgi:hypothetical protein
MSTFSFEIICTLKFLFESIKFKLYINFCKRPQMEKSTKIEVVELKKYSALCLTTFLFEFI